jgi:hypothetical protein
MFNGDEWEVLADPAHIHVRRNVSDRRIVLAADDHTARQLEWKLWPKRMFKGNSIRPQPVAA